MAAADVLVAGPNCAQAEVNRERDAGHRRDEPPDVRKVRGQEVDRGDDHAGGQTRKPAAPERAESDNKRSVASPPKMLPIMPTSPVSAVIRPETTCESPTLTSR